MSRQYRNLMLTILALAAIPVRANGAGILFEEDFEDGTADGITQQFGSWSIGTGLNGRTGAFVAGSGSDVISLDGVASDNVSVEADFSIADGGAGDFEVWLNTTDSTATNPINGYNVRIHPAGSDDDEDLITRVVAGSGANLVSTPATIAAGSTYRLRVDRVPDRIDVYLDDAPLLSVNDGTLAGGELAFRFFGGGTIDNIRVTAIPEPASVALLGLGGLALIRRRSR